MENRKVKIIFLGTPDFGVIILEKLIKTGYKPVLVVTQPDMPVGRKQILTPPPVKILAKENNIPILQPQKIIDIKYQIENTNPDLMVIAAYGEILPKEILDIPQYGCLNVHPSLLPRWRGPSPIQFTILNGDEKSGVTIIKTIEKIDAGPVIAQKEMKLEGNENYLSLHNDLGELGGELLVETIPKWINREIKEVLQDESKATHSEILIKDNGRIDWKKPAEAIERQIRAFYPWPGSFAFWEKEENLIKIEIKKARVLKKPDFEKYEIGKTLIAPQNDLCIQTGDGFLIVESLQMEGKKETKSEEFVRGHADFIGTVLSQRE